MTDNEKDIVKVKYTKSEEFRTIAASGAWGGLTAQGMVLCSLYVERHRIPENAELHIDKVTGKILKEEQTEGKAFEREMQVAIMMRPEVAKSIGEWLVKTSEALIPKGTIQ